MKEVQLADGETAWASDGAPSDCVALALLGIVGAHFDLVVSGINPMPNLGHCVFYSGTVTATMKAIIWGIPEIAFSLGSVANGLSISDYASAAHIAQNILETSLKHPLPHGTLLNVNIPMLPEEQIQGFRTTRLRLRVYRDRLDLWVDPGGRPYY